MIMRRGYKVTKVNTSPDGKIKMSRTNRRDFSGCFGRIEWSRLGCGNFDPIKRNLSRYTFVV